MAGTMELSKLLNQADYSAINESVRDKIEHHIALLNTKIEESNAKFEKLKVNSEQQYIEIESQLINSNSKLETESAEKIEYKAKFEELEKKFEEVSSELKKFEAQEDGNLSTQLKLSKANEQLECEKREFALLLEKRDREINTMNEELKDMSKKISQMNNEKFEAIAKLDEVRSLEVSKEFQKKRLEQEKENLQLQIDLLNKDVNDKMKQLMDVKREKSSSMLEIQSQLEEKTEECSLLKTTLESLRKTNTDQHTKIESLIQKIKDNQDSQMQSEEQFRQEIQARVRLVDLYKNSATEAENKSAELTGAVTELQKLLKEAAEAHKAMESEKDRDIQELKDEIELKDEKIQNLEQELLNANDLIESIKTTGMSEEKLESLFPTAAATSKVLKSGMSLTQIYNEYVKATDALQFEKNENQRLNTYLDQILQEIEEKAPLLKKQREDYEVALKSIDQMTRQLDSAMLERQNLRGESDECRRKANHLTKENIKQQQQLKDLSDQVRYLVKEIEELRGGRVVRDEDLSSPEVSSSYNAISENLVTFRNIEEMQEQNQKLLTVIRELSEKHELEEKSAIDSKTKELQDQLDFTKQELEKLQDLRGKETEILDSVMRQRDMYRVLLQQTTSTSELMTSMSPGLSSTRIKSPEKEDKSSKETNEALKQLQENFTAYKKEKFENDKIMNEQMEKMRKEASDLRIQNAKLSSQLEFSSEKYKVLQGNAESYRKEIAAKTEKIQKYSTSITKHEMIISTLREDLMTKQEKLAQAQARLENLSREKDIIKSSEQRLAAEQESLRREIRTQSQLIGNFQAIQINLERNEQDTKFRLGKQIETLEREKVFLTKRLETEEKQQEIAKKHYDKQINDMRQRLESELASHQRTKDQNTATNKKLMDNKQLLAQITQKLQTAESRLSDLPQNESESERASSELRDLKVQVEQSNREIQSLTDQLQKSKQHVEQYKTIADSVHQNMKEQNETSVSFMESLKEKLNECISERDHLKERVELLQQERQGLLTENLKLSEESQNLNGELRKQLTNLQNELQEAVAKRDTAMSLEEQARHNSQEQVKVAREAQDKYERELILHAANVEALTAMKERVDGYDVQIGEKEEEIKRLKQQIDETKASFEGRESMLMKEKTRLSERVNNLEQENTTLHEQMTKLSKQVVNVQERAVEASKMKMSESLQRSQVATSKDESGKSSEQLLEVIRYLRREKEIAEGRVDVIETECSRLKHRCSSLEGQLDSLNAQIREERQQVQAEMNTAAQHAELMHKVENYNILLDSNKMLREEKNQLQTQLTQTEAKLNTLEERIKPLQEEIRNAQAQKEAALNDSKAALGEVERWKSRTNQLVEQSHKTDPEEHKRLLQEREELRKQIMSSTDDIHQAKAEVNKSSQECSKLQRQLNAQKEEITKLKEEAAKQSEEFETQKEAIEEKDKDLEEKAKTITQLRKIGRKYKDQAELVNKEFEEFKAKVDKENSQGSKQAMEEQIKTLESKLKELESNHQVKVNELEQKISLLEQAAKDTDAKRLIMETSLKESQVKRTELENKIMAIQTDKEQMEQQKEKSANKVLQDLDKVKEDLTKVKEELDHANAELAKTKEELEKVKGESAKLKEEHTEMVTETTKLKEEKTELEKKLAKINNVLQIARSKLQALKDSNEKMTTERQDLKKKLVAAEESNRKLTTLNTKYEADLQKLQDDYAAAKKEASDLMAEMQKQSEELQKHGAPVAPVLTSRSASSVSDRTSSSPSEPPKTANIRPIASSPAAIKPQTVPVQPQSAASRVTASIRPMAIAPTSVAPMTSGTPTATVMPTTLTSQEVPAEGDSMNLVQQLFPQPSGSTVVTRPTQQVHRVIPTQESQPSSQDGGSDTAMVEPQQSTSRENPVTSLPPTNKRQREDLESPGTNDDALQKRQKVSSAEESQEIPEITVTDENATTTPIASESALQQNIDRQVDAIETVIEEQHSIENIFEMESQDGLDEGQMTSQSGHSQLDIQEEEEVEENDDDDHVIIVESDEGQEEEEYEVEEEEEEEEEDDGEEEGEEEEDYEGMDNEEQQSEGENDGEIDMYGDIGDISASGSQTNQQQSQDQDNDDVVIIDEGDDDAQSEPSSQPSSQSNSQTLLPPLQPILAPERQLSVGTRSQLTPFMITGNAYEDLDDCTVPSTPTLNVPRRGDGFAEAVSSPQVSQRFVFGTGGDHNLPGFPQLDTQTGMGMDDTRMDLTQLEDGTGRSVPSTPLHTTPPVTAISEASDVLSRQSELSAVSQSELNIEDDGGEGQLDEADGEQEEDILEGDQGDEDSSDLEHTESSEAAEGSTSQEDLGDKSQDANKPKIQKIIWEKAPSAQPSASPPVIGQPIQSLSQPSQYRPIRGAQRGTQSARRSFPRGGHARRSNRGRGHFTRRPPMY